MSGQGCTSLLDERSSRGFWTTFEMYGDTRSSPDFIVRLLNYVDDICKEGCRIAGENSSYVQMRNVRFYKAAITDILRCSQRDASFIGELQDYIADVLKLLSGGNYNKFRHYIPLIANSWYYVLTSLSSLQTLGEEYTGTIRLSETDIPTKLSQLLWLVMYVGGDKAFDKFLVTLGKKVHSSIGFTSEEKANIIKIIDFLKENKYIFLRLHQSIFYMSGTYQNIANRLTGIKYVLLRQWLQDTSATASFNVLGRISFLYLLFLLVEKFVSHHKSTLAVAPRSQTKTSSKICVLCMENCKNVCATPCGHLFCWECIHDSLKYQSSCAMCRETVNPSRIVFLQNYL